MSNTPSKAEIEALVKRHGATSYRNRADTRHPAAGRGGATDGCTDCRNDARHMGLRKHRTAARTRVCPRRASQGGLTTASCAGAAMLVPDMQADAC